MPAALLNQILHFIVENQNHGATCSHQQQNVHVSLCSHTLLLCVVCTGFLKWCVMPSFDVLETHESMF